jgi:hypothetical protein
VVGRPRKWTDDAERKRAYRAANPGLDKRIDKRTDKERGRKRKRPGHSCDDARPFIAIDGEAYGEQGYHLLAHSRGDQIVNPEGLSSLDCLRFLLKMRAEHPSCWYVGYALGYDCEMWIRDLGTRHWKAMRDKGKTYVDIDGQTFSLEYIPKKWFKLKLLKTSKGKGPWTVGLDVFDIFSFYQMSFIKATEEWGAALAEEMEALVTWKARRGTFEQADWEKIERYNQIELDIIVRLSNRLRASLLEIDIRLRSWHGPGAVANALLKRYNMSEHISQTIPPEVHDAIRRAYFGGRFQVFRFGHLEHVYDYDISSAYPYATTLLPSTQGVWERVDAYQGDEAYWCVYRVSWADCGGFGTLTPFPWRDKDGCIHYPASGCGWYWGWEVAAARRGFGDAIRVEEGWRLYPLEEGVFGWMKELSEKRVEAKRTAKLTSGAERERWLGIARAYKLALNSVYGKTIQTAGKHRPFLCPMWAGLITAHTRSRLMDAAGDVEEGSLVCFATDGLFSGAPIATMIEGSNLGDWELDKEDIRLELYQSGCYAIYKNGELLDSRFRGVPRTDVPWDDIRLEWKRKDIGGKMVTTSKRFIGHRTALQHNKPETQATWVTTTKDAKLYPGCGVPMPQADGTCLWYSALPQMDYTAVSYPYRKLPDAEPEQDRDEEEVQP